LYIPRLEVVVRLRKLISLAAVMSVFLAAAGCGTLNDHVSGLLSPRPPMPYGGVSHDLDSVTDTAKKISSPGNSAENTAELVLYETGAAFDLPLSAIADTILLPITLHNAFRGFTLTPQPSENDQHTAN
jgi:uncharacterized protein YceK